MLDMVSYSRRPQSGHITCYLNRTYHVLLTIGPRRTGELAEYLLQAIPSATALGCPHPSRPSLRQVETRPARRARINSIVPWVSAAPRPHPRIRSPSRAPFLRAVGWFSWQRISAPLDRPTSGTFSRFERSLEGLYLRELLEGPRSRRAKALSPADNRLHTHKLDVWSAR
jgi:hypothetical protein